MKKHKRRKQEREEPRAPEIGLERSNGIRVVIVPMRRSPEDPPSSRERARLAKEAVAWGAEFREEMSRV